jgi:hypothetical protein
MKLLDECYSDNKNSIKNDQVLLKGNSDDDDRYSPPTEPDHFSCYFSC